MLVFGLPSDVVAATLGDIGVEEVVDITNGVSVLGAYLIFDSRNNGLFRLQLPDSLAIGVDRCLAKCNLKRGEQTTTQQQPRIEGNAFP